MKNSEKRFANFLKRNAGYVVLSICVLAIGLSTALVVLNNSAKTPAPDNSLNNTIIQKPVEDNTPVTGGDQNEIPDQNVDGPTDQIPDVPVVTVISFIAPIENASLIQDYSETMVWSSTLKRFETHKAVDYFADEGTPVLAVYDGEIESVEKDLIKGVTVTINHGDGLKTIYNSLGEDVPVMVGEKVTKGQTIGFVSVSNRQEYKDGAHLHFAVSEDGVMINPLKYLDVSDK